MKEITEEGKRIAKEVLHLTDDEIDSFWFRVGYGLTKSLPAKELPTPVQPPEAK